jgi:prophage antirepressor-like protein
MDIVKAFNSNKLHTEIVIKGTYETPLFRASDIGQVLDISCIRSVIRNFNETEKVVHTTHTPGGSQEVTFLTEKGLYKVLFKSRKPIAETFQNWVCEVIKDIRLTGAYTLQQKNDELENKLRQANNENKDIENRNKESYTKLLKEKELDRQKILLAEYDKDMSIIYIIKVKAYENGEYVIKIGESRRGITNRFAEHKSKYEEATLLDCFAVNRSKDFESFLHSHENIKPSQVTNLEGHTTERELFLIGRNLTYLMVLNIIKHNIKYFDGINREQLELETEKLKLMTILNATEINPFFVEMADMIKLILDKITRLEQSTNVNEINRVPAKTVTGFNTPLVTLGPRLQKINPETFQLVHVYETVSECMNENNKIKRPSLSKAISENTVYEGFRWLLVDRNLDATKITTIEPTKATIVKSPGYIAKLNPEKTEILNVYLDRKTAAVNNGYESTSALDIPVKQFKVSRGYYYLLYDNCDDNLKNNFTTKYGEPLLYKDGVGQYNSENQLVNSFACKYDCIRILKMSDKTLAKALDKGQLYEGHYYRQIGSKLQTPLLIS